jgi:hypothetical protein
MNDEIMRIVGQGLRRGHTTEGIQPVACPQDLERGNVSARHESTALRI